MGRMANKSRYDQVGYLSQIYNLWSFNILWNGFTKPIEPSDLGTCPEKFESKRLADQLEHEWKVELSKPQPSFLRASVRVFGQDVLPIALSCTLKQLVRSALVPLMMTNMIQYFSNPETHDYKWACLSCVGVIATRVLYTLLHHPRTYFSSKAELRAKVAWMTMIYRKILRLNMTAFGQTTVGQIVNLISNDASVVEEFCYMFGFLISSPVITVVGTYLCYQFIGNVIFIGFGLMVLLVPLNYYMSKYLEAFQERMAKNTDHRVNLMTEILKFMRTIKMYAWERHFANLINEARKKEINEIRKSNFYRSLYTSTSETASSLLMFAMFVTYALLGYTLNSYRVYSVMAIYSHVIFSMTWFFADAVLACFTLRRACNRIQTFLMLDEIGESKRQIRDSNYERSDIESECSVVVKNATIQWNVDHSKQFSLEQLTLEMKRGEFLAVIGAVGSGKSTLLMAMLNEPSIVSGLIRVNGRVAYAAQEPWCFHDTIEANILFGLPFEQEKWNRVIEACALSKDIEAMQYAEKTLVGERGVILSGGQKARISLARALYSDADVYLLDDPLSAVDTDVARHIIDHCIGQYLRHKTVILVTHQVQYIKQASKVLVLDKGQPLAYGTQDQVLHSGIDLLKFISHKSVENETDESLSESTEIQRQISSVSEKGKEETPKIEAETMETGTVRLDTYRKYFQAGASWPLMLLLVIAILMSQTLFQWSGIWLAQWTNDADHKRPTNVTYNVLIYAILILLHLLTTIFKFLMLQVMCRNASITFHQRIFNALMRAPISFFDHNPTGRILNRFTKDLNVVDNQIVFTISSIVIIVLDVIGSILVISYYKWYLSIPALIVFVLAYYVRVYYARPSRDMTRYEATLRSPIFNHATLTLAGLSTIRAFQAEPLLVKQYYIYQNDHSNAHFTQNSMAKLVGFVNDWFCQGYIFSIALALMIFYEDIGGGTAGMILTMAFELSGPIQWAVRVILELESHMTSVERLEEYSKLEQEAALETNYQLPDGWPNSGRIEFDHASLTYDGSEKPVLKDVSFEVQGGEKVAIVGRTGAGKSSILAALFRIVEVEGRIAIDGVNCRAIGLHQLRRVMSIIPQEPMAFVGTLRNNLDPFNEHSSNELWDVLRQVQLKATVEEWPLALDHPLNEGGSNLSVGQRQLICLARALLRKNQILILDEATANVDHQTDQLIQRFIRSCFAHCTVITIAHRLNTIIDSDRILVLDSGRVVQFDTPRNLFQQGAIL